MARRIILDFESASDCDLKEAGAWRYWEDPTTEILCLVAIDAETKQLLASWTPLLDGLRPPPIFQEWAADPDVIFEAHNAAFEQAGWAIAMVGMLGLSELPPERWDCTMARAFYRGLPGGLEPAARVLGLGEQKDKAGSALTISLSKPMTQVAWMEKKPEGLTQAEWKRRFVKGTYDRTPETLRRVTRYCYQDDLTEGALGDAVGHLSAYERRVWILDQRMNQRGLLIDRNFVAAAINVVEHYQKKLLVEFERITGIDAPTKVAQLKEWCARNGFPVDSLAKDVLASHGIRGLAEDDEEGEDDDGDTLLSSMHEVGVPDRVRRALQIRLILGSASIAKLYRIQACVCSDGRVRYTIQYHGAGTGRWAGRLFQPQNFPRGKIEGGHEPEQLVRTIMIGLTDPATACELLELMFGCEPIAAVASGLRHAIIAGEGHVLNSGDFAGIEMRDVLGLAGQRDRCELIAAGANAYLDFGQMMFGRPISKSNLAEYIPAKAGVLGSGFGCGPSNFNIKFLGGNDLPMAEKVVGTYRKDWAPKVPKLWKGLEAAAFKAFYDQTKAEAYGVVYEWHPGWMAMHLPDGQTMWYRDPQKTRRPMPWDHTDIRDGWSYKAWKGGRWKTIHAYGGLLTENAVQKRARGYLVEAMVRLEQNGFPLVLTCHDECVSETPLARADQKAFEQIMREPTRTSKMYGVPIEVEGWMGQRYKK